MTAALGGCAAGPNAALPTAPPIPDGWATVERGGLRMALPPDWVPMEGQDDITVSFVHSGGGDIGLMAHAPPWDLPPPNSSASQDELTEWLVRAISTSRPERYSSEEMRLPAGRAVVVRFRFPGEGGSYEAVAGVAYAIRTTQGIVFLQINMSESLLGEYEGLMDEVPLHLSLAGPAG